LDALTLLASRAADAIMRERGSGLATRYKADKSPVTRADEAAEDVILDGLARAFPHLAVVSEESGLSVSGPIGPHFFLVDPLDGTRELIAGREEFTVNIALLHNGEPAAGVIAAPALGLVWRGHVGRGAERMTLAPGAAPSAATDRARIHARAWSRSNPVAAVSRSHLEAGTRAYLSRWPGIAEHASGSSIKFCRLAEGAADIYPRLSATRDWDIAAGHAILRAAGGEVLDPDGSALRYGGIGQGFRVPGFIAWGDPAFGRGEVRG
jgi:3'(2'), 5'-bisphosphate nucleotidase